MAEQVDLLVIGGGPGGYAAALRGAQLGRRVVLVERDGSDGLGGTCARVGCIPSKALIELANIRYRAGLFAGMGLKPGPLLVELAEFQVWKNQVVSGLTEGVGTLLRQAGVEVLQATAAFSNPGRVALEVPEGRTRFLEFRSAVVATGSAPTDLPNLPVDGVRVLDSTGALALERLPSSIAVVGAGYIGLELGTAFAKLGSSVTIVEKTSGVLPGVDPVLARTVHRSLAKFGVTTLLGTEVVGLSDLGLVVAAGGDEFTLEVETIIVAAGRQPSTGRLRLDIAGADISSDGLVKVNASRLATTKVAAVGDITAGPALAHKASAEAEVAVEALSGRPSRFEPAAIPSVVYSDPEVVTVGLSEQEAGTGGVDVRVLQFPFSASGRAATLGAREGMARLVVERGSNAVLGVHMVGVHVAELAGEAALAVEMSASAEDLAATIHPHPTISEAIREVAALAEGRPLHVAG